MTNDVVWLRVYMVKADGWARSLGTIDSKWSISLSEMPAFPPVCVSACVYHICMFAHVYASMYFVCAHVLVHNLCCKVLYQVTLYFLENNDNWSKLYKLVFGWTFESKIKIVFFVVKVGLPLLAVFNYNYSVGIFQLTFFSRHFSMIIVILSIDYSIDIWLSYP